MEKQDLLFRSSSIVNPTRDIGEQMRDKNVQRATAGTLYVIANSVKYVAPVLDAAANLVPLAGQVMLSIQAGHSIVEGGRAYVTSMDQCYGMP